MRFVEFRTPKEKAKGLQFIPWIEPNTIYIFPNVDPGEVFHSRNVPEPFDLAFLNAGGVVLEFGTMMPPHDLAQAPPETKAAIEAKAGTFERMDGWNLSVGL